MVTNIPKVEIECRSDYGKYVKLYNPMSGEHFDVNCHSWRCPKHREQWSKKVGEVLAANCAEFEPGEMLLVNLTTARPTDHDEIAYALQKFMEAMRLKYGRVEYSKIVEYNRKQTQPHFHMIFRFFDIEIPELPVEFYDEKRKNRSFPFNIFISIRKLWQEAIEKAWHWKHGAGPVKPTKIVWCQPPRGRDPRAAAKYAVGYIAGGNGHKDYELPNETWLGRRFTYSKNFFLRSTKIIWQELLEKWFGKEPKPVLVPVPNPETEKFWPAYVAFEPKTVEKIWRIWRIPSVQEGRTIKAYAEFRPQVFFVREKDSNQYSFHAQSGNIPLTSRFNC